MRSGSLKLDANTTAGQIVFDMPTFVADTDEARKYVGLSGSTSDSTKRQVNDNMLGPDVLNVKEHPTATFDVDSALPLTKKSKSDNPIYQLRGTFHLRGVSRPLVIEAEAVAKGNVTRLRSLHDPADKVWHEALHRGVGCCGCRGHLTIFGEIDVVK